MSHESQIARYSELTKQLWTTHGSSTPKDILQIRHNRAIVLQEMKFDQLALGDLYCSGIDLAVYNNEQLKMAIGLSSSLREWKSFSQYIGAAISRTDFDEEEINHFIQLVQNSVYRNSRPGNASASAHKMRGHFRLDDAQESRFDFANRRNHVTEKFSASGLSILIDCFRKILSESQNKNRVILPDPCSCFNVQKQDREEKQGREEKQDREEKQEQAPLPHGHVTSFICKPLAAICNLGTEIRFHPSLPSSWKCELIIEKTKKAFSPSGYGVALMLPLIARLEQAAGLDHVLELLDVLHLPIATPSSTDTFSSLGVAFSSYMGLMHAMNATAASQFVTFDYFTFLHLREVCVHNAFAIPNSNPLKMPSGLTLFSSQCSIMQLQHNCLSDSEWRIDPATFEIRVSTPRGAPPTDISFFHTSTALNWKTKMLQQHNQQCGCLLCTGGVQTRNVGAQENYQEDDEENYEEHEYDEENYEEHD